ncbi:GNAT family N-acetyltransferase [Pedobacter sp. KR3-3]|uniref:GNAT family N-acetyltransferase n=1 Tax=Pedobacter albus TaxID=3113905 RepID=A0ABU7IBZ0_9SPHI|nr:GNAT family N-acetyltransferase [Pedobacter sp. KR3-3]MEE1946992.1 GNAT family N-acetyltransferase [Pedobacter sp. KR3-3]
MEYLLDNPIYHALNSAHGQFAKGTENVKFYEEDIASFAGLKHNSEQEFDELYHLSETGSTYVVFSPVQLTIHEKWKVIAHIDMFQFVYEAKEAPAGNESDLINLNQQHVAEMMALVELTKPGPFRQRTIELGNYTGIFENEKLVAMAGHRFNPTPYTEVSAVCTHPDYLGKGYAYELIREQIKRILVKGEIPFLHVRNDNAGAIKLYEKLGFRNRGDMYAYVIRKEVN